MLPFRTSLGMARLAARIIIGALTRGAPRSRTVGERLAALPRAGLPLNAPVAIRWNDHQIPWIEAEHDTDLAVALGVVHAHLRLAQMEAMRRAAWGRLAEVAGPAAVPLDHTLRTLHLTRAVPAIEAALPAATRAWMESFAAGINAVVAAAPEVPEEFALLGVAPEPWTVADLLALGRLAATDFTWRVWLPLLRLRGRSDWERLWQRMMRDNALPVPSFAGTGAAAADPLSALFAGFPRQGSNAVAVSGRRAQKRAAMIASDPHLSVMLPNTWLIAGMSAPGFNVVGLMIPGVPAVALGRNPRIGWGGTSLHAQSSELFDVGDLPDDAITHRRETIAVRWGSPVEVTIRDTGYGPIITDAPLIPAPPGRRLALHWIGHGPSDEVTALLKVNRASGWDEFVTALDGFAVPAQNMIYADTWGRVGQCMAAHLPRRPHAVPPDLFVPRSARAHWESIATASHLPMRFDPEAGFVASANNRPEIPGSLPVGFFFSPDDRVRRLRDLLGGDRALTVADLEAAQRDVLAPSALDLRDRLLTLVRASNAEPNPKMLDFIDTVERWDGRYDRESAGALAFELLVYRFARALRGAEGLAAETAGWEPWARLRDDLERFSASRLAAAMAAALPAAAVATRRYGRWGDVHRLRLAHPLGRVPVIGRRYRFVDEPVAGGNETVMKTAHGLSGDVHAVRLGANARHISDFADRDDNRFVLLGGQDGWPGSTTFLDQHRLWTDGATIRVPLRAEAARAQFPHTTTLSP